MVTHPHLAGIIPILSTPFEADGSLDETSLRALIRFSLSAGATAIAGLGDVSECHKLTEDERRLVAEIMVDEVGRRIPVIVGVSASSVAASALFARHAEQIQADAVLVKPTLAGPMNQETIQQLFQAVADATTLPIMAHDMDAPAPITLATLEGLAARVPTLRWVKEEMQPSGGKVTAIRRALGERLGIITGYGGRSIIDDLERGADGNMPGCHIITPLVRIYDSFRAGDLKAARAEHNRIAPLIMWRQVPSWGIAATKHILRHYGVIATTVVRSPTGVLLDERDDRELVEILESIGPVT